MQALGNDFMVIDALTQPITPTAKNIIHWANRHTGVGFDQCLLIEPPKDATHDFFYRIYNADGTESGQCGNGARCIARYLARYIARCGQALKPIITVKTISTVMKLRINQDHSVTVSLPEPLFSTCHIKKDPNTSFLLHTADVGNPHAVLWVDELDDATIASLGQFISEHAAFPNRTNVEFVKICSPQHIKLRVYERGIGETLACGSGAIAAATVGIQQQRLNGRVQVTLPGGSMFVEWDLGQPVQLTGSATFVYDGILIE